MKVFILAALLCSVASYLHTLSRDPSMRPENPVMDLAWRGIALAALVGWGAMVVRGFVQFHWTDGLAALLGSIALNWYFGHYRGPKPTWPGLSMLFGVVGLGLAGWSLLNE
jgi:hypothetical protein